MDTIDIRKIYLLISMFFVILLCSGCGTSSEDDFDSGDISMVPNQRKSFFGFQSDEKDNAEKEMLFEQGNKDFDEENTVISTEPFENFEIPAKPIDNLNQPGKYSCISEPLGISMFSHLKNNRFMCRAFDNEDGNTYLMQTDVDGNIYEKTNINEYSDNGYDHVAGWLKGNIVYTDDNRILTPTEDLTESFKSDFFDDIQSINSDDGRTMILVVNAIDGLYRIFNENRELLFEFTSENIIDKFNTNKWNIHSAYPEYLGQGVYFLTDIVKNGYVSTKNLVFIDINRKKCVAFPEVGDVCYHGIEKNVYTDGNYILAGIGRPAKTAAIINLDTEQMTIIEGMNNPVLLGEGKIKANSSIYDMSGKELFDFRKAGLGDFRSDVSEYHHNRALIRTSVEVYESRNIDQICMMDENGNMIGKKVYMNTSFNKDDLTYDENMGQFYLFDKRPGQSNAHMTVGLDGNYEVLQFVSSLESHGLIFFGYKNGKTIMLNYGAVDYDEYEQPIMAYNLLGDN